MQANYLTPREYFKSLSIIHIFTAGAVLVFGVIASFLIFTGNSVQSDSDTGLFFFCAIPLSVIGGFTARKWYHNNKLSRFKENNDLKAKLESYRETLSTGYSFIAIPGFLSFFAGFITGSPVYLVFNAWAFALMIKLKPTIDSVIADLALSQQEISILENPDIEITAFTNTKQNSNTKSINADFANTQDDADFKEIQRVIRIGQLMILIPFFLVIGIPGLAIGLLLDARMISPDTPIENILIPFMGVVIFFGFLAVVYVRTARKKWRTWAFSVVSNHEGLRKAAIKNNLMKESDPIPTSGI